MGFYNEQGMNDFLVVIDGSDIENCQTIKANNNIYLNCRNWFCSSARVFSLETINGGTHCIWTKKREMPLWVLVSLFMFRCLNIDQNQRLGPLIIFYWVICDTNWIYRFCINMEYAISVFLTKIERQLMIGQYFAIFYCISHFLRLAIFLC